VRPRRPHWRLEDLEIWKKAVDLAVKFHRIAERLDKRRLYRYAEQLRAAGLSISNNIAEGSAQRTQTGVHSIPEYHPTIIVRGCIHVIGVRKTRLTRKRRVG
jgi:23S rRNA-intervening sequence protein